MNERAATAAAYEYVQLPENWPTLTARDQAEAEVDAFLAGVRWARANKEARDVVGQDARS